jgi:hypothetical protein
MSPESDDGVCEKYLAMQKYRVAAVRAHHALGLGSNESLKKTWILWSGRFNLFGG